MRQKCTDNRRRHSTRNAEPPLQHFRRSAAGRNRPQNVRPTCTDNRRRHSTGQAQRPCSTLPDLLQGESRPHNARQHCTDFRCRRSDLRCRSASPAALWRFCCREARCTGASRRCTDAPNVLQHFRSFAAGTGSPADNARPIRRVNARGKPLKVAENGAKPLKTGRAKLHGFAVTSPRRSPRRIPRAR